MPATRDLPEIRAILHTDPVWSLYGLGDLAPAHFERSVFVRAAGEPPTIVLLYRGFEPPVLFALGPAERVRGLLAELGHEGDMYLHVRPDILPLLEDRYEFREPSLMWRMPLPQDRYRPAPADGTVRLRAADVPALEKLYADGASAGESPHFFFPSMVEEGVFCGVYEGEEMIAAAGTHLVIPAEGVAAIGNIYTRRDHRSRGLAARTTSAVVNELLRRGLPTIALNVNQQNAPAIRVYERLGFVPYCAYYEALAIRRRAPGPPSVR
jgi:ribosomal protein S18 acetylase RimI-like enzyme